MGRKTGAQVFAGAKELLSKTSRLAPELKCDHSHVVLRFRVSRAIPPPPPPPHLPPWYVLGQLYLYHPSTYMSHRRPLPCRSSIQNFYSFLISHVHASCYNTHSILSSLIRFCQHLLKGTNYKGPYKNMSHLKNPQSIFFPYPHKMTKKVLFLDGKMKHYELNGSKHGSNLICSYFAMILVYFYITLVQM